MNKIYPGNRLLIRSLLILALVWPAFASLEAQDAVPSGTPYTLDQCIAYAMQNQKNIQNATFDKYIAEKQVKELLGVGLPQVSGSAQYQQYIQLPQSLIDITAFPGGPTVDQIPPGTDRFVTAQFGLKYNLNVGVSATQLLFDGSYLVGVKAAKEFASLQEINIRRTEVETAVAITKAYYSALLSEERAQLLNTNLAQLDKLLETTEGLYKEGFAEKVDVDRLAITRNNLVIQKRKTERLVDLGFDLLKFQMGMPVSQELELVDRITESYELPPLESLVMEGSFVENRYEFDQMNQGIRLNELDVKRNRMGVFGTLALFGNYQLQTARPTFFDIDASQKWFPNSFFGLSYNVTFFDGLQKSARIQKANLEIAKLRNQMDMFEQGMELEMRSAAATVSNAWMDVESAKQNEELAKEVFRIATTKYSEGVGSNLEVLDAQNSLTQSQINYLTSLYDYVLATVELKRVKGEIKPQDLLNPIND
jgi:outer membrane protein TolC